MFNLKQLKDKMLILFVGDKNCFILSLAQLVEHTTVEVLHLL